MRYLTEMEAYDPDKDDWSQNTYRGMPENGYYLTDSLDSLLRFFGYGCESTERPVLLIDNICLLEKYAGEHGYQQEMERFLQRFLSFEPDKKCCLYMQVWDGDSGDNDYYRRYFCCDPPYLPHSTRMSWREEKQEIHFQENRYAAVIREPKTQDPAEMEKMILEGKVIMLKSQKADLERKERDRIERMERYRRPLAQSIPKYSDNMGLRRMKHLERNEAYFYLNNLIRDIYEKCRECNDYEELYIRLQNVRPDSQTDWNREAFEELCDKCGGLREGWEISLQSKSQYWYQIGVGPNGKDNILSKIKVYVSIDGPYVKELFVGAVEKLIREGSDGFLAKISKVERDESICFYVKRNDFFLLENYLVEHSNQLRKGMPFVAHRGLLGISKDLMDIDSYNAQQARLLWDYFQIVACREEIDVEEMYQMFVLGWNSELSEDSLFDQHFSEGTAQLFVLMMDSIDVLMEKKRIDDDSLLLNDDPEIWNMLAEARCWGDVGQSEF